MSTITVFGAISGILALVPFIYIWLIIKEVIEVMPNFTDATNMIHNGWMAVIFALLAMIVNFSALMCSHLSAFRIASNMRIKLLKHITKLPIGKIDDIGTGKLRKIVSEATGATETYLAHQLPDYPSSNSRTKKKKKNFFPKNFLWYVPLLRIRPEQILKSWSCIIYRKTTYSITDPRTNGQPTDRKQR